MDIYSKEYRFITFYKCRKCGQIVKDIDTILNSMCIDNILKRIRKSPLEYKDCSCIAEDCISGRAAMDFIYYLIKEE